MTRHVYIHGTGHKEQARLAELNRLTNPAFVDFVAAEPGGRVLEVGSGLGILAADVARSAAGVGVVAVEYSPEQLGRRVRHTAVTSLRGDAQRLPFRDGVFDLVYARYLLEHVADPLGALREMRRVVKPRDRVAVLENDISLVRIDPPCPAFERAWTAFARLQERLGGDGLIGRLLYRLFRAAGFAGVVLSLQPEVHWHGSPGFAAWIENLAGNLRGAGEALVASGIARPGDVAAACDELAAVTVRDDASATFAWNRAVGLKVE